MTKLRSMTFVQLSESSVYMITSSTIGNPIDEQSEIVFGAKKCISLIEYQMQLSRLCART